MIRQSDAIVIGTVREMTSAFAPLSTDIVTYIDLDVEQVIKGNVRAGESLRLVELGGIVGTRAMLVSAAPTYWTNNRALIFLEKNADGDWRTYGAPLGKFDFVKDSHGRSLAVRWAAQGAIGEGEYWNPDGQPHEEKLRDSQQFLDYLQTAIAAGKPIRAPVYVEEPPREEHASDYFVDPAVGPLTSPYAWDPATNATYPPSAYTQGTFRWDVFDKGGSVTFKASGSQPGYDYIGTSQRALAAWTDDPGSNVRYVYGGTSSAGFVQDNQNTIVYNSSTDVPSGALAFSKWYGGASHTYKGETFYSITEGDAVMKSNPGVTQKVFDEAITHELGHTLGFRHSDAGTPSSTAAVMKAVLSGNYGATLGPWDIEAVRTVYEETSTATLGIPANLVARATSTTSVTITWSGVSGATGYQLERSSKNGPFVVIATVTGTSYVDNGVQAGVTYLYRVHATSNSTTSGYSNTDWATTIIFVDDPLVPGTAIKAIHLTQLRDAVNAMRAAVGLAPTSWTDPSPAGVPVKAIHIIELRNALTAALTLLGKTAVFTDPALTAGMPVKAVHFQELRNYTK